MLTREQKCKRMHPSKTSGMNCKSWGKYLSHQCLHCSSTWHINLFKNSEGTNGHHTAEHWEVQWLGLVWCLMQWLHCSWCILMQSSNILMEILQISSTFKHASVEPLSGLWGVCHLHKGAAKAGADGDLMWLWMSHVIHVQAAGNSPRWRKIICSSNAQDQYGSIEFNWYQLINPHSTSTSVYQWILRSLRLSLSWSRLAWCTL
jgi:hypothetical protein